MLKQLPRIFLAKFPGRTALVFSDTNTWNAAGQQVQDLCIAAGIPVLEPIVFPVIPLLHTDENAIAAAGEALRLCAGGDGIAPIPIAVGSGTLNDIVKRAAYEAGIPYICVPTAPSVDGYTSFGAAAVVKGFKTTLPCDAPVAVVADQDVMAAAPYRLLAAGYGDLAAKLNSGRDWLLASAADLDTIEPDIWQLSQGKLQERLSRPDGLSRRDPGAVRAVFDGLCDTGLAMQDRGDSRPASGSEHHFSHCLEMYGLTIDGQEVLHGEKVAAGTLLATAAAEAICALPVSRVRELAHDAVCPAREDREREVRALFAGTPVASQAVGEAIGAALAKLPSETVLKQRLDRFAGQWSFLQDEVFRNRPRTAELTEMFKKAGCPGFSAIGIDRRLASWALHAAQTIRTRYTVLDLAYELGLLDTIIAEAVTII
jgi:glycerol-1-phosphate dehydrogenase [NAD(P)+]